MSIAPGAEELQAEINLLVRLFPGGGEMGARIRALDWSRTRLGPVQGWPQSLRTAVSIMLGSRFPMMVHWGPELIHFYNDGYATILQTKHPGALGEPAESWWREMWPFLQTIFEPVLAGQTTYFENSLVLPNRQGFVEETYFTFSHSPIYDEAGTVGGIFVTALETTTTVLQQRRLALLSHLMAQTALTTQPAEAAQHLVAALATNAADIPFALLYIREGGADHAQLRAWFGLPAGEPIAPATVPLTGPNEQGWPLAAAFQQPGLLLVPSLTGRFGPWPAGDWAEAPRQALVLPLGEDETGTASVLVVGLSARLPLDEAYQAFFALVGDYAGRALARATASYEAQRLNQLLREINASLDSFVHIVAHDLKGPVNNLRGLLDAYYEQAPGPTREQVITLLDKEVHRLSTTLEGVLQLLQVQYGATAQAEFVAWADVFATVQAEVADLQQQTQGILTADFGVLAIRYPRVYLESVLKNLVHNALKYRAVGRIPLIRVRTRREGSHVVLTVTDNGRGIDLSRDQERLFQPFTRLTAEGQGAGLGLYMIRTLVQQRGGSLEVTSTVGQGTTFTVILPEELLTVLEQSQPGSTC